MARDTPEGEACPLANEAELERRVYSLELGLRNVDGDINSLRASRHEQGNQIQLHTLEISEINQRLNENHTYRLAAVEKGMVDLKAVQELQGQTINALAHAIDKVSTVVADREKSNTTAWNRAWGVLQPLLTTGLTATVAYLAYAISHHP